MKYVFLLALVSMPVSASGGAVCWDENVGPADGYEARMHGAEGHEMSLSLAGALVAELSLTGGSIGEGDDFGKKIFLVYGHREGFRVEVNGSGTVESARMQVFDGRVSPDVPVATLARCRAE